MYSVWYGRRHGSDREGGICRHSADGIMPEFSFWCREEVERGQERAQATIGSSLGGHSTEEAHAWLRPFGGDGLCNQYGTGRRLMKRGSERESKWVGE